jgi:hypothetical protein
MKQIDDLYSKGDVQSGDTKYFTDKELSIPFTGIVSDASNGHTNSIFELKEGLKDGIEKVFHEDSDLLEQVSEYKKNLQFGVSKEYDEQGELVHVSVVWNNKYLKTLTLSEQNVIERDEDYDLSQENYPERIVQLLKLTDHELIDYSF